LAAGAESTEATAQVPRQRAVAAQRAQGQAAAADPAPPPVSQGLDFWAVPALLITTVATKYALRMLALSIS
jgi:hypothetical protein